MKGEDMERKEVQYFNSEKKEDLCKLRDLQNACHEQRLIERNPGKFIITSISISDPGEKILKVETVLRKVPDNIIWS